MNALKSPFAQKFDELVEVQNTSYRKFAKSANVTPAYVSQIMSGVRSPTQDFANKTAKFFKLNDKSAEELRYLASISQRRITLEPRDYDEAKEIIDFVTRLALKRAV